MQLFAAAVALFIAATANAAALPAQDCKRDVDTEVKRSADFDLNRWCAFPGQGCKRAVDSTAEFKSSADVLPDFDLDHLCAFPGQGCKKVKRAADAVSEYRRSAGAVAKAIADLDQE